MATITIDSAGTLGRQPLTVEVLNRGEESFRHDLQEITEAVQADRAEAVAQARALQLAAQLLLAGEAARLARRAPDDLRVAALAQGAERALAFAGWLEHEATLASVRVPMVKQSEALLHGRVTDDQDRAAGPVLVRLVDAAGRAVEGVAPVEADSAGYYALVVPAEVAAALPADGRYAVALEHGAETTRPMTEPSPLASGVVKLQDIRLGEDELTRLKLRPHVAPVRPREGGTTPTRPDGPGPVRKRPRK